MISADRKKYVEFADTSLFKAYEKLKEGTFEEKELAGFIDRAIQDLKKNPLVGDVIAKHLFPKEYIRKHRINNLRVYNLPNAWRLIYTLKGNEIEIISIILEWFDHKRYASRFGYKKK